MTTTSYFANCTTQEEIKNEYRRLAKANHPDLGGSTEVMVAINAAYEQAVSRVGYSGNTPTDGASVGEVAELVRQAIEKVITLPNITIEVCGDWVWLSGETYPVKDAIKAAGYKWASVKKMWFFAGRPASGRGGLDIDEIRQRHGSVKVAGKYAKALA